MKKKKVYEKPSMREHKFQHQTRMLAASDPNPENHDVWDRPIEDDEVDYGL